MVPNDAEAATNSSVEARTELFCWYAVYVTAGDESHTIALWIIIGLVSLACPTIVVLNVSVITTLRLRKELQRLSNVLLLNMATSDLLIGAICMPLSAIVDSFVARQTQPENVCVLDLVTIMLMRIFSWSSVLHLTLIAWERYVAIQKYMQYKSIFTRSRLNTLAIVAWVSATFMVLPDIILLTVVNEDDKLDFSEAWFIVDAFLAVCALGLVVYFYVMVYLGIRKRKISEISQVTSLISAKLENRVAKMTALVTAVLLFSFLPILVVGFLSEVLLKRWAYRLTEILVQFNSIANPLIYCYGDRRLKNAVLELLRVRKLGTNQPAAVAGVRFVSRKGRFGSVENVLELQEKVNVVRFTRRASCDQAVVLDCSLSQLKSCNTGFKRSMSAPSLAKLSSAAAGNVLKSTRSLIVECTAMIHSEREGRRKARKSNRGQLPEAVKRMAAGKEERKFVLTDSWKDIKVLENEREKGKIHLKRSASFDLTVAYVTFHKVRQRSMSSPSIL